MAADITVIVAQNDSGWSCSVQVSETNGQTRHSVKLSRTDFDQLTAGKSATPEALVRRSFEFLLERESKESILRQFDLPTISRFFPEYPSEIRKRL